MKKSARYFIAGAIAFLVLSGPAVAEKADPKPASGKGLVALHPALMALTGFKPDEVTAHSIGQSHIDVAWRWRMAQTHDKVYKTFLNAVENIGKHPGFGYSQSQPLLYEWMLADHPELFARIKELEKQGKWEITGGMWVEPDCNMPEGESFARQYLLGQRFYLEHFGHASAIEWLPDTFGYNRNLPQFASRAGVKYLWTKKLTTNFETAFPFHNYFWRGPDGSSILVNDAIQIGYPEFFPYREFMDIGGYRYLFKYDNLLLKPGAERVFNYAAEPAVSRAALSDEFIQDIPVFYGVGDGGMGPQEREIVNQERLVNKGWAIFSNAREYFRKLEKYSDRLPVWDDELYLERHRGVQTTHGWLKRANRFSENLLRSAETLNAITSRFGAEYQGQALKAAWKIVCANQFHDILPGSSIPEVYEDAKKDYAAVEEQGRGAINAGLKHLAKLATIKKMEGAAPVLVFNPLGWERAGMVKLEVRGNKIYQVLDREGKTLASQSVNEDGKTWLWFRTRPVPPVGYSVYYLKDGGELSGLGQKPTISDSGNQIILENEFVRATVCKEQGWITSLMDKASGKEMIDGASNRLLAFSDRHKEHRAWNIDPDYYKKPIAIPGPSEVKISASGPLFVEATAKRQLEKDGKTTVFVQKIRLVQGDPIVYLDMDSDYHLENSLLKLEFNTTLAGDTIAADGPYLTIERPTHPQTAAEKARWEMANQKWIDLSDHQSGIALLNNGKYGFSLTESGKGFRQTLIKGAEYPEAESYAENAAHYKKGELPYTDQGSHHIELGLLAHKGDWRGAKLYLEGYNFNVPLETVLTDAHQGTLPEQASFVSLDSQSVYLGIIKRAEDDDDIVLRLVEAQGRKGQAVVKFGQGLKISSAAETDLIELNPRPLPGSGSEIRIDLSPYEIRTIKLQVNKNP